MITETLLVRLAPELKSLVRKKAEKERRSMSQVAAIIIEEFFSEIKVKE